MRSGKPTTLIGIGLGLGLLMVGAYLEGSWPSAFFNVPAALIVFGGTIGATLAGTGVEAMKRIPALYRKAIKGETPDLAERLELLVSMAENARRDGLLALDSRLSSVDDPFTRKGLQLVVDGTDPEVVRTVLENEMEGMAARHQQSVAPFEKAAGYAPTMGIIGTVMGLINVLKNLSQPATLGPAISVAFIATLYGVGMANCIFLPVATRLKQLSEAELELYTMTLEGVLSIQAGDNPRVVTDKLLSFIPPAERDAATSTTPEELVARADELAAA